MVASRGPVTSAVSLAFLIVSTVFVAARFFTRTVLVRSIKQDDWWILAAWVLSAGFTSAICVGVSNGLGKHMVDIPVDMRDILRRSEYAFSVLYNPCLMLTKTSIIVFYLSVMSKDVDKVFKWLNWITLAIVNIGGLSLTFLSICQCSPVSAGYVYPTPNGSTCTDIVSLYLSSAPVNIITDLALLILPMPILTGMRLPKKQKIILVVTFGFGGFVAVVDVVRIAYLQTAALDRFNGSGGIASADASDFSWYAALSFMWSAVEVHIGIICACVPSLKPLFLKFLPRFIHDEGDSMEPGTGTKLNIRPTNDPLPTDSANIDVITNPAAFRRPTIQEYTGDDDGDYMGFLNMLQHGPGPGLDSDDDDYHASARKHLRRSTTLTNTELTRTTTALSTNSEFDFVKLDRGKNMLKLSNRQSVWPVAVVTVIFFMWGFAYGLLNTLNGQFQVVARLSQWQTLGLHAAYFGGYFIGPLTLGRFILHRYGFKATMMAGLCVYGCGTLVFWPSAVLTSYAAFIISNLIVGTGLSCLEVAANPYIALCGPLEYAEVRLNLSQAFQAVGTVVSPLLAERVLFKDIRNAPSLVDVQWTYLGISLFDFALAVAFYYIRLPEATSEQLEELADKRSSVYRRRIGPYRIVWWTLAFGVFSQWCYVGAQEGIGGNGANIIHVTRPPGRLTENDYSTIDHVAFAVGRFLGAFANYLIKPRWILLTSYVGIVALVAAQMHVSGATAGTVSVMTFFFEGSVFPIIFAICMRGMGDQTFNAAALMTASISAGAVVPPIQNAVLQKYGLKYSYSVLLGFFAFGTLFPIYLCLVPAAKRQVDPIHEHRRARRDARRNARRESTVSGTSTTKEFGLLGIIARKRKKRLVEEAAVQPTEDQQQYAEKFDTPVSPKSNTWDEIAAPNPVYSMKGANAEIKPAHKAWYESSSDGSSRSSLESSSESRTGDGGKLPTNKRREWTEEDDVRADYHEILRDI